MTVYLLLFILPAWFALTPAAHNFNFNKKPNFKWQLCLVVFTLAIGLRHEVGGDWFAYIEAREALTSLDFNTALANLKSDAAYSLITWISPALGGDYFVNLVCGLLFTVGLTAFCRNQPDSWLALAIAVPYLVIVVAMGYTRQGVAIGLTMLALLAQSRQNLLKFLLWIAAAASFHKSAVVLVPLALFAGSRHMWRAILGVIVVGSTIFILFLQESVDRLIGGYFDAEYESSGALVRVMMNALPAAVFLIWRRKFALNSEMQAFWTWMSTGALLFLPALVLSPSSTAVDRLALYWIPIQIFVWSRLPRALSTGPNGEGFLRRSVVAYSLAVLLVWLLFADHAFLWIPYKFYPWELIKDALFH